MSRPITWTIALLLVFAPGVTCRAGDAPADTLYLDLARCVERALGGHREGERVRLGQRENRLDRLDARLRLMPALRLSGTLPGITDSEDELWNAGLQVYERTRIKTERRSGSLSLGTELPLGTVIEASSFVGWRESDTGSFLTRWSTNYSLGIRQQLLGPTWLWDELAREAGERRLAVLRVGEQEAEFRHRVAREYYALLQARLGLGLARTGLREAESSLDLSRRKYGAGIIGESDFLKSELEVLDRRSRFASDSLALELEEREFRSLVGVSPGQPFSLDATVPLPEPVMDLDHQLSLARERSLALAEQRLSLAQNHRSRRQAFMSILPTVQLELDWSQSIQDSTRSFRLSEAELFRTLSLRLDWGLWDWGRKSRALQRARISERRGQLALAERDETLEQQVRSQFNRIRDLQAQLPLRSRQLELASRDHQISQERYTAGLITSQELIDAERTLSSVRLQELAGRISLVLEVAALERLTGADRRVEELP
jgi:outer membrane protein TolC